MQPASRQGWLCTCLALHRHKQLFGGRRTAGQGYNIQNPWAKNSMQLLQRQGLRSSLLSVVSAKPVLYPESSGCPVLKQKVPRQGNNEI